MAEPAPWPFDEVRRGLLGEAGAGLLFREKIAMVAQCIRHLRTDAGRFGVWADERAAGVSCWGFAR